MSHEIRTPMNAIIGFTKIVLKTNLTIKQKEYLNAIKMSGDSLIVIIDDILDLAKVDSGKMGFVNKPFKMAVFITGIVHLFESRMKQKKLALVIDYNPQIPEILLGDSGRLTQIILNILSNAEKFTSKGTITIQVGIVEENTKNITLKFAVSDTGIGIAADQFDAIFENFQQASTGTSRLYGGTGLGLAIAKQLVELQGGKITVESKIGKGSTFKIVMLFQKTKLQHLSELPQKVFHPKIKNISVLVVEDVALNQLLVKTILDDFRFENDFADNGQIAIAKLRQRNYDIILMDLQMPIMNGFEATAIIRNELKLDIPIIALTADVTTVDLGKCKALGMDDYIAKPIDEHVLLSKIVSLVNSNHEKQNEIRNHTMLKYVNLEYLNKRTKSNPKLMEEMITLYLEQTPKLVHDIKTSIENKDWESLNSAVHKMIPSFSIMGMSPDFENMAKKIQEFASTQQELAEINTLVLQLENVCLEACGELEHELITIKNKKV